MIHASRTVDRDACREYGLDPATLPRGVILGVVTVADCKPPEEPCRSKWAESGSYHWLLTDPHLFHQPVQYTGRVSLFNVPLDSRDGAFGHKVLASLDA